MPDGVGWNGRALQFWAFIHKLSSFWPIYIVVLVPQEVFLEEASFFSSRSYKRNVGDVRSITCNPFNFWHDSPVFIRFVGYGSKIWGILILFSMSFFSVSASLQLLKKSWGGLILESIFIVWVKNRTYHFRMKLLTTLPIFCHITIQRENIKKNQNSTPKCQVQAINGAISPRGVLFLKEWPFLWRNFTFKC